MRHMEKRGRVSANKPERAHELILCIVDETFASGADGHVVVRTGVPADTLHPALDHLLHIADGGRARVVRALTLLLLEALAQFGEHAELEVVEKARTREAPQAHPIGRCRARCRRPQQQAEREQAHSRASAKTQERKQLSGKIFMRVGTYTWNLFDLCMNTVVVKKKKDARSSRLNESRRMRERRRKHRSEDNKAAKFLRVGTYTWNL